MPKLTLDQESKYYGGKEHRPPEITQLKAGSLSCQYEAGYLRYLKVGNKELLRMIYPAVRDHNWGTIAPQISNEKIVNGGDHFRIYYDCLYQAGEISFQAQYCIVGSSNGEVSFEMNGTCLQSFRKNRIGFNVLHPPEAAGAKVVVKHTNGEEEGTFPIYISPHQPFTDIQSLRWLLGDLWAKVEFEGDVFEMEDQQNWTDASFKTYSTPLAIPFPVKLSEGERISQSVKLSLMNIRFEDDASENLIELSVGKERNNLPEIGVSQSSEVDPLIKWFDSFERKALDEHSFETLAFHFDDFNNSSWSKAKPVIELPPYAILLLRSP